MFRQIAPILSRSLGACLLRWQLTGLVMLVLLVGAKPLAAQDLNGVWRGKWTADATERRGEHGGALRIRLQQTGPNSYQGRFSGRFALVIPYFYRAEVVRQGNTLVSSKKLGGMGEYRMQLQIRGSSLVGGWNAGEHRGEVQVRRRR